jgi:hypothetical protein
MSCRWSAEPLSRSQPRWASVRECHPNLRGPACNGLTAADREANSLRERCHLKLELPRLGCHGGEPLTIMSGGGRAALVEQVGRASESVEILAPGGRKCSRHVELSQLIGLLAQQPRELREEFSDAPKGRTVSRFAGFPACP